MTATIDSTVLSNHEEFNSASSFDLARRFEWRLQWEKTQLENWQSYQSPDQPTNSSKANETGRVSRTDINTFSYTSSGESDSNKMSQKYTTETIIANSSENKSVTNRVHANSKNNFVVNNSSETLLKRTTAISKQTTTPPTFSGTYLQYKKPNSMNMHIYQYEGGVEIALRDKEIKNKKGIELIENLKNDLAKLGLNLTKLKLNGEVIVNTNYRVTSEPVVDCADDAPINRTY